MAEAVNFVEAAFRFAVRPREKLTPWQWGDLHFDVGAVSPFRGMFRSDTSPWIREPLEAAADNRIRFLVVMCAAQSSKTTLAMLILLFWIATDPGPIQWVMSTEPEAKTFVNTRLRPSMELCKPVSALMPANRKDNKTLEINFGESPLLVSGAAAQNKLQGNPKRYLLLDEVRNWKNAAALPTVLKRITSWWNGRAVLTSTGGVEGDQLHNEFLAGDQRHYYVPCPHCQQSQVLEFDRLKWDENETTRPGGEWSFDALALTVRYECKACGKAITDNYGTRRAMALAGVWVAHNAKAASNRRSYTWSALIVPWIPWARIVEEFLLAKIALANGSHEALKTFITETLGEVWVEEKMYESELKPTGGDYLARDKWDEEILRFCTIDKQKDHYWVLIRAWAKSGASRLVYFDKLRTEEDLKACVKEYGVDHRRVFVDCGYEENEVLQLCCANGWKAFKGDERVNFACRTDEGEPYLGPYTWPPLVGKPGIGTASYGAQACAKIHWSNPTIKDVLARLKNGKAAPWGVPIDVHPEFSKHMSSEMKKSVLDKRYNRYVKRWVAIGRRPNHGWDCECMQVVCAMLAGLIANPFASAAAPDKEA